jgi:hypothetical protein
VPREQQIVRGLLGEQTGPAMSVAPTKFQLAHAEAQRNAALPVAQGGLGLGPQNTAMERAKALGYRDSLIHGSPDNDIEAFSRSYAGSNTGSSDNAVFATKSPNVSGYFSGLPELNTGMEFPETSYPLLVRYENPLVISDFPSKVSSVKGKKKINWDKAEKKGISSNSEAIDYAEANSHDAVVFPHGSYADPDYTAAILDPSNIRSRFAAFDPKKRDSRDLLASMGLLGLLGAGAYGQDSQ